MAQILVIDSEPTVRTVVKAILEQDTHTVRETGDFKQALTMISNESPDLVLTNVYLQGITGHEAMAILRDAYPNLRVLMVSGLPDEKAIHEWVEETRFAIFPKPFTSASLLNEVRTVLRKCEQNA